MWTDGSSWQKKLSSKEHQEISSLFFFGFIRMTFDLILSIHTHCYLLCRSIKYSLWLLLTMTLSINITIFIFSYYLKILIKRNTKIHSIDCINSLFSKILIQNFHRLYNLQQHIQLLSIILRLILMLTKMFYYLL